MFVPGIFYHFPWHPIPALKRVKRRVWNKKRWPHERPNGNDPDNSEPEISTTPSWPPDTGQGARFWGTLYHPLPW
jgi:hypothetical protein